MAEIIEREPDPAAPPGGWMFKYLVRRDDGEQIHAEAACPQSARVAAEKSHNTAALAIMEDRGEQLACELAEQAVLGTKSVVHAGLLIRIRFDPFNDGAVRHDYVTEETASS